MKFNENIKINNNKYTQKLEDILPILKPTKEEIEYNNQFRKAADLLMSNPDNIMESLEIAKKMKKPERQSFTKEEENIFLKARANIVEQLGYKILINKEKFLVLEKDGYTINMKHFMLPSSAGYNNGRISEIEISKDKIHALWSNGWNHKPKDNRVITIFNELMKYIN